MAYFEMEYGPSRSIFVKGPQCLSATGFKVEKGGDTRSVQEAVSVATTQPHIATKVFPINPSRYGSMLNLVSVVTA